MKDRAARAIVQHVLAKGLLRPGVRLLDASSGNTGIAYAMLGAALGFGVTLCLPANANHERQKTLAIYGAEIIRTDPTESTDGAIIEARRLAEARPADFYYADQYANPCNWQAHYGTTGPRWSPKRNASSPILWWAGHHGHLYGGGSLSARAVAPRASGSRASVLPGPFHGLEGLKHLESAMVPPIYDADGTSRQAQCSTEDAYTVTRRLAREEGLMAGVSTGAAVHVALQLARSLAAAKQPGCIVVLAPDGGSRYLSETFWEQE